MRTNPFVTFCNLAKCLPDEKAWRRLDEILARERERVNATQFLTKMYQVRNQLGEGRAREGFNFVLRQFDSYVRVNQGFVFSDLENVYRKTVGAGTAFDPQFKIGTEQAITEAKKVLCG